MAILPEGTTTSLMWAADQRQRGGRMRGLGADGRSGFGPSRTSTLAIERGGARQRRGDGCDDGGAVAGRDNAGCGRGRGRGALRRAHAAPPRRDLGTRLVGAVRPRRRRLPAAALRRRLDLL